MLHKQGKSKEIQTCLLVKMYVNWIPWRTFYWRNISFGQTKSGVPGENHRPWASNLRLRVVCTLYKTLKWTWLSPRNMSKTYYCTVLTNFKWLLLKTVALLQQIYKNNFILFYQLLNVDNWMAPAWNNTKLYKCSLLYLFFFQNFGTQ